MQLDFEGAKWTLVDSTITGDVDQYTVRLMNATNTTMAFVKMRYYNANGLVEADVTTLGIDYSDNVGKDYVVNFQFDKIDAKNTFWTDSNGLEMQERILNHRNMWNFTTDQNISSNYYPVDSAIGLKDDKQKIGVTVMNDRSQGGSAELVKGNIELIQSRRMLYDDGRGVGENLDEWENSTDKSRGVIVNARYWIDVYSVTKNNAQQRSQQLKVDMPVQLYYAMDYKVKEGEFNAQQPKHYEFLGEKGAEYLKMLAFPLARNSILFRLENLYDVYDGKYPVEHVDVTKMAMHFFWKANPTQAVAPFMYIEEVDITNNQLLKEAEATRASKTWKAEDDEEIALKLSKDEKLRAIYEGPADDVSNGEYAGIALQPQRIRSFKVTFSEPEAESFLQ